MADNPKAQETAVRGLGYLLRSGNVEEHRAAVRALGEFTRVLTSSTERVSQESIPTIALTTIPAATSALGDADAGTGRAGGRGH